jgi:Icc-related predicted phosphoesterase
MAVEMKCLIASDLHYNLKKYDFILAAAEYVNLLILPGDFLEVSLYLDRPSQALVVDKYFQRISRKTRLMVCSGNHDLDSRDTHGELVCRWLNRARAYGIHTDGESVEVGGALYSMCLWWDGENGKRTIAKQLERDADRHAARWIWLHHAPPAGSPVSWNGKRSYGDTALRDWIETHQPDFVYSGHVHQAPFVSGGSWVDRIGRTWVFNAGHQLGPVPSYILLDSNTGSAWWKGQTGLWNIALDAQDTCPAQVTGSAPDWVRAMDLLEVRHLR